MPQNRTTIRFAVAVAASVIAAPALAQQEPCLGNSVPLTGPAAFGGLAVKYGAETAIDEINEAGGVLGKKLTLIQYDDAGAPPRGVDNVRRSGLPFPVAVALSLLASCIFGVLVERFAVRPFAKTATSIGWMLTTIAVGIMLEALVTMRFGGFSRALPSPGVAHAISIFGAGVYPQELLIPAVALVLMFGFGWMQRNTLIGRAMQAVSFDRTAAGLMGINVNAISAFSFALAAALGGAAGILVAPVTQASATMGLVLGLKGFAVAIIGGITSAPGVVIAGLGFGVLEKFVEGYISTSAREIIGFSVTILVLLIFPQGLFGKREVFKV